MNLAQMNLARLAYPLDALEMKDFVDALPEINGLADGSPGFVWRLADDIHGDSTSYRPFEDRELLVTMSVWESLESLRAFVYQSHHMEYLRRRREWFRHAGVRASIVLWWVPQGHIPTLEEAKERLTHLEAHGPTGYAFTFRRHFPAPEEIRGGSLVVDRA